MEAPFLVELTIIIGSALSFSLLTWKLRVPTALGQLIAGMVIGPFGLRLVTNLATIDGVAEIGIVLLLFILGLELDPFQLRQIGVDVFIFSFVEMTVSFMIGLFAGFILGWSIHESVLLASIIGISSTAIIVKMLYERRILAHTIGRMMCGALIVEDILAIFVLSLIPSFVSGNSPSFFDFGWLAIRGALLFFIVFVFGTRVAPRIIDKVTHVEFDVDEAGFLLSLAIGFAMAAVAYALGFSAGTGAFLIGLLTLGKRAKFVLERIRPVRDLFIVIFFVSMGMLIDPSQLLNPALALPVVGLAVIGKYVGSYLGAVLSRHKDFAGDIAISMNPRGEFSFIIARNAISNGIARALIYPTASIVVVFTCIVSAILQIVKKSTGDVSR